MTAALLAFGVCFAVAALVTGLLRRRALRAGLLDVPNERSSHSVPTPRGGGLAIVAVLAVAMAVLVWCGGLPSTLLIGVLPAFVAVAIVGWIDDRRGLSPLLRLAVHLGASAWCLAWVYDPALWGAPRAAAWVGDLLWPLLLWLGIGWAINLFNFMDGIDGLAGGQGLFMATIGAAVLSAQGNTPAATLMLALGGSCAGFLAWNWPPARIFMGDVGSGALGFVFAAVPVATIARGPEQLWPWLIVWGVFLADSTVTLLRRTARGARPHEAHRTHAYQMLARRWRSHGRVTAIYGALNVAWLAPLAWLAATRAAPAAPLAVLALVPVFVWVFQAGAGRSEDETR